MLETFEERVTAGWTLRPVLGEVGVVAQLL